MIDLHLHTAFSDGKDTLDELIDNIAQTPVKYFSITDHDIALSGRVILTNEYYQKKIKKYKLNYVTGIEFTCKYNNYKVHILAYDFNPNDEVVLNLEQKMTNLLKEKDLERFKIIEQDGYVFSIASKEFLGSRLNVRKLDIANCLVNDGYFDNVDSACQHYLNKIKYPKSYRLDAIEVISSMSKIGAKLVWAHSLHGINEKKISVQEVEQVATELKKYGLVGLECYYSLYNKNEIDELISIAKKLDFIITAGSDYHGKNKNVKIAETSCDNTKIDFLNIPLEQLFIKNVIK